MFFFPVSDFLIFFKFFLFSFFFFNQIHLFLSIFHLIFFQKKCNSKFSKSSFLSSSSTPNPLPQIRTLQWFLIIGCEFEIWFFHRIWNILTPILHIFWILGSRDPRGTLEDSEFFGENLSGMMGVKTHELAWKSWIHSYLHLKIRFFRKNLKFVGFRSWTTFFFWKILKCINFYDIFCVNYSEKKIRHQQHSNWRKGSSKDPQGTLEKFWIFFWKNYQPWWVVKLMNSCVKTEFIWISCWKRHFSEET